MQENVPNTVPLKTYSLIAASFIPSIHNHLSVFTYNDYVESESIFGSFQKHKQF